MVVVSGDEDLTMSSAEGGVTSTTTMATSSTDNLTSTSPQAADRSYHNSVASTAAVSHTSIYLSIYPSIYIYLFYIVDNGTYNFVTGMSLKDYF